MRLLLIRHGETVDNVAGIYAGITDSPLTTHGVLQASRLATHLAATCVKIPYIFSSDLQRAFKTAEAIRLAQPTPSKAVIQSDLLREQDFGFYEGKHFYDRPKGSDRNGRDADRESHMNKEGFQDVESKLSMRGRVNAFLECHLIPLFGNMGAEEAVAVVAHGIILTYMWRGILSRFHPGNVAVAASVTAWGDGMGLEYLSGWSNTGYLDLEVKVKFLPRPNLSAASIQKTSLTEQTEAVDSGIAWRPPAEPLPKSTFSPAIDDGTSSLKKTHTYSPVAIAQQGSDPILPDGTAPSSQTLSDIPGPTIPCSASFIPPKLLNTSLVVIAVNSQEHLKGLRKTRGGIGSLKHDEKQKTMDSFFKRQKLG